MSKRRGWMAGAAATVVAGGLALGNLGQTAAALPSSQTATLAGAAFKLHETQYQNGAGRADDVYLWSRRWMDAEKGSASAAKDHLARMKAFQTAVASKSPAGLAPQSDIADAAFYVSEAADLAGAP